MASAKLPVVFKITCCQYRIFQKTIQALPPLCHGLKHHHIPYMRELYRRRLKAGPAPEVHRSQRLNWDYDAELYAFANRISEKISSRGLQRACTDRSYSVQLQDLVRDSVGEDEVTEIDKFDNVNLSSAGQEFTCSYIRRFLQDDLPDLPTDGIDALVNYLVSDEKLSHIASNLGLDDLIMCGSNQEINVEVLARALFAVIGVVLDEQGVHRAEGFVRDFITTQLIGEDIDNIVSLKKAMNKLEQYLLDSGRGVPKVRLLGQFGAETAVSCYYVGIYSDKKLIGKAPGETLEIAEDMAARDALMTIYGIQDNRLPFKFEKHLPHSPDTRKSADLIG